MEEKKDEMKMPEVKPRNRYSMQILKSVVGEERANAVF